MSTYLRLLHLVFWMTPLQRGCTVLGVGVLMGLGTVLFAGTELALGTAGFGALVAFSMPALLGGAFWRALSAPRAVQLAPHGRARLWFAVLGVAVTIAFLWVLWQVLFDQGLPPEWRTAPAGYRQLLVSTFAMAIWLVVASFFASRSPLAMLLVLLVIIASWVGLLRLGISSPGVLWWRWWGIALPLALWATVGIWYLRARRIVPPGWLLPGGQSVFAAVAMTDTAATGASQRTLLERLLLGGTSVPRLATQWLLAGGLLLGILLLLARWIDDQNGITAHFAFGALILCPVIVAVQSVAAMRRSRSLWLISGYSRQELFAFVERALIRFAIGMTLVFTAFLLVLWYTQPWHPGLTLAEALLVMLLPSLQLATQALMRPRRWDFYWRWPLLILLCWFIAWKPLTSTDPVSWFGPRGWFWFTAAGVAILAFHTMARRRWLAGDLPRLHTRESSDGE